MSDLKTITLWGHKGGPNSWKVAIILEELSLPYEHKFVEFPDMKKEPYISVNPNGRVPAIYDPNTDITLWESGACIDYIIDTYDKDHLLSYATFPEKYITRCWEHFQMSGQGPMFGQRAWFMNYHPEKNLTSVLERYHNEVVRVTSVIDSHLRKQGSDYLVGDHITYADLMFVTWANGAARLTEGEALKPFEAYAAWLKRLNDRPVVVKVLAERMRVAGPPPSAKADH